MLNLPSPSHASIPFCGDRRSVSVRDERRRGLWHQPQMPNGLLATWLDVCVTLAGQQNQSTGVGHSVWLNICGGWGIFFSSSIILIRQVQVTLLKRSWQAWNFTSLSAVSTNTGLCAMWRSVYKLCYNISVRIKSSEIYWKILDPK